MGEGYYARHSGMRRSSAYRVAMHVPGVDHMLTRGQALRLAAQLVWAALATPPADDSQGGEG